MTSLEESLRALGFAPTEVGKSSTRKEKAGETSVPRSGPRGSTEGERTAAGLSDASSAFQSPYAHGSESEDRAVDLPTCPICEDFGCHRCESMNCTECRGLGCSSCGVCDVCQTYNPKCLECGSRTCHQCELHRVRRERALLRLEDDDVKSVRIVAGRRSGQADSSTAGS